MTDRRHPTRRGARAAPVTLVGSVALVCLVFTACASGSSDREFRGTKPTTTVAGAPGTAAATLPGGTTAAPTTSSETSTTSTTTTLVSGTWRMPDLVGRPLNAAKSELRGLTGDVLFRPEIHDQRGDRLQIVDGNWKVCLQDPRPGTVIGTRTHVVLGVVKTDEDCPTRAT